MNNPRRDYYDRRLSSLKSERASFMSHWIELSSYILPRSNRWFTTDRNKGDRRSQKIINDTATHSARTLSSGMMGGLTSPARPWFMLRTQDPAVNQLKPVKVWLEDCRQAMLEVFLKSNLYQALPVVYEELGVFGTSAFLLMEDEDTVIRCYSAPLGSYVLGTNSKGQIDSFAREYQMSHRQLVAQFGLDACSDRVKAAWNTGQAEDLWVDVVHFIEPNQDFKPWKKRAKYKEFASVYYEAGEPKFLSESGFDEFPVMAARWGITGEDIYATKCPGMQALGDIKMLQLGEKRKAEAIDKLVRPPMKAPSSLQNGAASMLPGGITYIAGNTGQTFEPAYVINPHLEALEAMLRQVEGRIERAFFADLFLMISNIERGQTTAEEIRAKREEKMLMLGPVLERLNDELFDPLIRRVFAVMQRRNLLPPPPPELQSALTVEYVSILAQAQKLVGVAALERLTNYITSIMPLFQSAGDKFDADEAIDQYASMIGAGPKTTRDAKEAAQIRFERSQREAMAQNLQAGQQAAQTAQTLSQTPLTDDTALSAMLSRLGGGA